MNVLFIYGPPAVGKLTIAREVATRTGWRLFHNHLAVDLALSLYDFGTPGFIALREAVWLAAIRQALADRVPGLIFTFSPEQSVPQRFIDELFAEVPFRQARLTSIALTAPEAVIEQRIGATSRKEHRKLVDLELYRRLRTSGTFASPQIPRTDFTVDTSSIPPVAAAERIIAFVNR